jgi:hypothetical protein
MKTFNTVHQITDDGSRGETLDDLKEMFGEDSNIVKLADKLKLGEDDSIDDMWIFRTK